MSKKEYVQFSKRMVMLVFCGVIALTASVLALLFCGVKAAAEVVSVFESFMTFAGVVFVAYSGNSAYEKYIVGKYTSDKKEETANG